MTISAWSGRALSGVRGRLFRPRVRKPVDDFSWAMDDDDRPASQSLPTLAEPEKLRFAGTALVAIGALLLGFAIQFALVSQVSYVRDQQLALTDFRYQLANATAPVGQTGQDGKLLPLGTAVALLAAPSIGLTDVVFEGTTSEVTKSGPGHRRDTALPGQSGASVVYGRQAAYGAPFASIAQLVPGATITATTGQGVAKYTVTDVRYTGDPVPSALSAGEGRLTLVSAAGLPFLPQTVVRVDAKLTSAAQPTPDRVLSYAAIGEEELTMAGDGSAWPLLVLALILLVVATALFTVSRRFWGTWQTWIVAVPVTIAIGLFAAGQLATVLPNLM
ncbi:sortase [soil metagenome]